MTVNPLRRIARSSLTLMTGDAFARVIVFVTTVTIARRLGPAPFGLVTFAQALLGYLLLLSDWGTSIYGVRAMAGDPTRARATWIALTWVRVALAILFALIAVAITYLSPLDPTERLVVALTLVSVIAASAIPDWASRGAGRMKLAASLSAMHNALALVVILAVVSGPASIAWVPAARLAAMAVVAVIGTVLLGLRLAPSPVSAREWIRERGLGPLMRSALVLLLANGAVLVYSTADQLILKVMRGDHETGLYGSAYRIIQLPLAAWYAVTMSALPELSRLWREDPDGAARLVRRLTLGAAAAGVVIAWIMAFTSGLVIGLVYGAEYAPSAHVLVILAFAVPLEFVASVKGTAYVAAGRERGTLVCVAIAAITNVVGNLIWIPAHGMFAAAWVTLASYAALLIAYALVLDTRWRARA
jgi:O-antigen/teichoic acid export membrane protein